MGDAAAIVESEYRPDFIDINLGCPARRVVRGGEGAGAALLLEPSRVREIAEGIRKKIRIPLSAKIRTGWDNEKKHYTEVVKALEDGGVSFIIVHGRTVAQKYTGKADWNIISRIAELSTLPVVGNGDITSYDEALERLERSGCSAVMIGRGAVGNPWIFSGKTPTVDEVITQIKEHLELMVEFHGEKGTRLLRKQFASYIHGFRNASKIRRSLVTAETSEKIVEILDSVSISEKETAEE
jgi:tRNA-dihydrouridine synthase B